jgi:hypothetical protein
LFRYGLAILLFAIVIPATVSRIARSVGPFAATALAFVAGLAYGIAKSEDTWSGQASPKTVTFVLACAFILAAYAAVCLGVARIVGRKGA